MCCGKIVIITISIGVPISFTNNKVYNLVVQYFFEDFDFIKISDRSQASISQSL